MGWGTEFFDYDNDGDQDLYVANGGMEWNTQLERYAYAPNAFFVRNSELPAGFVEQPIEEISDWWLCEEPEDQLNRPWVSV